MLTEGRGVSYRRLRHLDVLPVWASQHSRDCLNRSARWLQHKLHLVPRDPTISAHDEQKREVLPQLFRAEIGPFSWRRRVHGPCAAAAAAQLLYITCFTLPVKGSECTTLFLLGDDPGERVRLPNRPELSAADLQPLPQLRKLGPFVSSCF